MLTGRAAIAGYSGTPLPKKLGIRAGARIALVGAPAGFRRTLGPLPEGVRLGPLTDGEVDLVLFFSGARAELEGRFVEMATHLDPAGALWVAWPKRSSGVATDLTEAVVRQVGLAGGPG